jgi:hypothetical protein
MRGSWAWPLALAFVLAGCGGDEAAEEAAAQEQPPAEPVRPSADQLPPGTTPVSERTAVLGLLNKRNGIRQDLTLKPGQAVRVGDVIVRLRSCEVTPPWEPEQLTGAFVQVDVRNPQDQFQRVFSGWLWRESPSLNVVEHPIYDVDTKSCEMTHPAGPGSSGETPADANANSSAPKSGAGATPSSRPKAAPARDDRAAAASNSAASNSR